MKEFNANAVETARQLQVTFGLIDALFHSTSKLVHCRLTYDGPGSMCVATVVACSKDVDVVVSIFCNG